MYRADVNRNINTEEEVQVKLLITVCNVKKCFLKVTMLFLVNQEENIMTRPLTKMFSTVTLVN